jgi:hypothetical protein
LGAAIARSVDKLARGDFLPPALRENACVFSASEIGSKIADKLT